MDDFFLSEASYRHTKVSGYGVNKDESPTVLGVCFLGQ